MVCLSNHEGERVERSVDTSPWKGEDQGGGPLLQASKPYSNPNSARTLRVSLAATSRCASRT
jgi:hypothetical protein